MGFLFVNLVAVNILSYLSALALIKSWLWIWTLTLNSRIILDRLFIISKLWFPIGSIKLSVEVPWAIMRIKWVRVCSAQDSALHVVRTLWTVSLGFPASFPGCPCCVCVFVARVVMKYESSWAVVGYQACESTLSPSLQLSYSFLEFTFNVLHILWLEHNIEFIQYFKLNFLF